MQVFNNIFRQSIYALFGHSNFAFKCPEKDFFIPNFYCFESFLNLHVYVPIIIVSYKTIYDYFSPLYDVICVKVSTGLKES